MKKILLTTMLVALIGTTPIEGVSAIEQQSIGRIEQRAGDIDFKKDEKAAKEWAESSYEKWEKDLKKEERLALFNLNHPYVDTDYTYNINENLKKLGGDLNKRPIDEPIITDAYFKDVQRIEKALQGKERKLKNTLYVYKNDTLFNLA